MPQYRLIKLRIFPNSQYCLDLASPPRQLQLLPEVRHYIEGLIHMHRNSNYSIFDCGAPSLITIPLSPTLSRNPFGNASSMAGFSSFLGNLMIHMKLASLCSTPCAISSISSFDGMISLPNDTKMVDNGSLLSSHFFDS